VLVEEGIERAALPVMAELDPRDVVRRGALARGRRHHVGVGDEEKLGLLVDEAADEPGAGDPVDAGLRPGDPLHDALHPSSRRSRRSRMAARAAGSPSLTFGTSSHCSTLGPSGLPSGAAAPRAQPKAMTRVAPAAISRVTRRGFWPVRSTPSALSAASTLGAISGAGSVPAESATMGRRHTLPRRSQQAADRNILAT